MANKLIRASDARRAILKEDPRLAYCIDDIPAVDAVEVVRCKDCKYYKSTPSISSHKHRIDTIGICVRDRVVWGALNRSYPVKKDDFCSHGERKDGG